MIKTEFNTLIQKENVENAEINQLRVSDNTLNGSTETIASEVKLPGTRVQATPETGIQSSEGDLSTEWNIDEQDDLFASVMCSEWADLKSIAEAEEDDSYADYEEYKELVLGEFPNSFVIYKDYYQSPQTWQKYTGVYVNQLQLAFDLNSFVKATWSLLGNNQPTKTTVNPYGGITPNAPLTSKAFKTLQGSFYFGDDWNFTTDEWNRQISNVQITINNNMERTDALFETEAIEQSLGDFQVTGSFDYYNRDDIANTLYNDTVEGKSKCFRINVCRDITEGSDTYEYGYEIYLNVHLDSVSESKDGNKLKNTINFTMDKADGIRIVKYKKVSE